VPRRHRADARVRSVEQHVRRLPVVHEVTRCRHGILRDPPTASGTRVC
jgi:hypothetical protein